MKSLILYNRLKKNKLFKDSFWALTGTVVGKSLSLLAGILVVRFLGKEIYGEYGMIKSTLLNISIFTTLGLGYTGTRFISKFLIDNKYLVRDIIRKIYIVTSLFSGFIMILLFIFSEQVALYIEAPDTASAFRFTAFIVLINAVNTSQIGILAGLKAFKHTAINNSITGVITFICSVVLTFYMGLEGSLLALLLSLGIGCILNMCSINKLIKDIPYEKTDKTFNKELLFFSMPIAIQELLFSAVSWSSSLLVVKYSTYGELGILGVVGQWTAIILFIPGVLKNVALSYFSSDNSMNLFKKLIYINFLSSCIPCFFVAVFSVPIMKLYGNSFVDNSHWILVIGVFSTIFNSVSSIIIYEFISQGKTILMLIVRIIRETTVLLFIWLGLYLNSSYGAYIVVISQLCVYVLFTICIYILSRKFLFNKK
ncbi:oligosaccharide flippase family protein [uncultured Parabacteroides sp.]|uniref:oligosaccharide flippase family protein n=1 Tax=Parabacteroides goldsteinii TaxID=328812 RepID=UPI0025913707|nr:oligosaccharide flippase family protein [uncultured Parabacteroides sp.]